MNREDIIRMAQESRLPYYYRTGEVTNIEQVTAFAKLIAAAEREKLSKWMISRGYTTGHGDTVEELLKELEWQAAERERGACAKVVDELYLPEESEYHWIPDGRGALKLAAEKIRARGEK